MVKAVAIASERDIYHHLSGFFSYFSCIKSDLLFIV
jgi:hypothetical protein